MQFRSEREQRHRCRGSLAFCEPLENRLFLSAVTYYVSPTGNDNNSGTSTSAPWQTLAKVDAATFNPGDRILLQRGGQWHESLTASSSGTPAAPITYGAYGDPTLPKPTVFGSDPLNNSSFALLTGTTYSMTSATAINWIYDNAQFTHNSDDATVSSDPTTNLNYVEQTPESFYYNPTTEVLYVNVGGSLTGHLLTAATRQDCVFNNGFSYLIFENLAVTQTAADNGGYAFRAQEGNNVEFLDDDASLAGKHHFGDIDCSAFLGENLTAEQSPPDLNYGGASAFVTFSDNINGRANNTAQWINVSYTTPNGAYPAFISHGDPGAVGSLLVQNLYSSGYGTGIFIESTGPTEVAQVIGGHVDGGLVEIDTDNSVVDHLLLTGADADIALDGSNDVAQNCVISGIDPNPFAGLNGGIIDDGTNNIIRFNTFYITASVGPAIGMLTSTTNTQIYANIFDCVEPVWLDSNTAGDFTSNYNVFVPSSSPQGPVFASGDVLHFTTVNYSTWQSQGHDANSAVASPDFTNPANNDFSLQAASPAIDLYKQTPSSATVAESADFLGNPRPVGAGYDAGAYEFGSLSPQPVAITASSSAQPIYVSLISTTPATVGIWIDTPSPGVGVPTLTLPLAEISSLSITASDQNDQLTVDFTAGSFAISGGISFAGGAGSDTLVVDAPSGTNTVSTAGSQISVNSIPITYSNTESLSLNTTNGTTTLPYQSTPSAAALSIRDFGSIIFPAAPSGTGIKPRTLASLLIGPSDSLTLPLAASPSDRAVLVLSDLSVSAGGNINLGNNDMILHNGVLSEATPLMQNQPAGGFGIGSSDQTSAGLYAIGCELNNLNSHTLFSTFDNQSVSVTDILFKYTLTGDANLDGTINGSDFTLIDNGFNNTLTGWRNGDFNYDGVVNGDDYTLIDDSFNHLATAQAATPSTQIAPAVAISTIPTAPPTPAVSYWPSANSAVISWPDPNRFSTDDDDLWIPSE